MKVSKYTLLSFLMLIVVAAAYRAIPGRPWGFAPQFAMAIFGGAVIKDKKLAFLLPLLSLLISDVFYELLYINGIFEIKGFYSGMWINYLLFGSLTIVGFFIKNDKLFRFQFHDMAGQWWLQQAQDIVGFDTGIH